MLLDTPGVGVLPRAGEQAMAGGGDVGGITGNRTQLAVSLAARVGALEHTLAEVSVTGVEECVERRNEVRCNSVSSEDMTGAHRHCFGAHTANLGCNVHMGLTSCKARCHPRQTREHCER